MTNKERYLEICRTKIHREGIELLLGWLEASDFFTAPASTKFHGNYDGGLCQHSLNVYDTLCKLAKRYEPDLSEETIAIAALFHDVCKVNFYKRGSKNVKDPETGRWYAKDVWEVDEKIPLGHGEKSCIILQWYIKLTLDELLAIRWHMGAYDAAVKGGEYGFSKAQDCSALVTLLNVADVISSGLLEETINQ